MGPGARPRFTAQPLLCCPASEFLTWEMGVGGRQHRLPHGLLRSKM